MWSLKLATFANEITRHELKLKRICQPMECNNNRFYLQHSAFERWILCRHIFSNRPLQRIVDNVVELTKTADKWAGARVQVHCYRCRCLSLPTRRLCRLRFAALHHRPFLAQFDIVKRSEESWYVRVSAVCWSIYSVFLPIYLTYFPSVDGKPRTRTGWVYFFLSSKFELSGQQKSVKINKISMIFSLGIRNFEKTQDRN